MKEYLEFTKKLSVEAGEIALKYFGFETETTWKEDNSPLTQADTEINDLVIKRINETYPDHSIHTAKKKATKKKIQNIFGFVIQLMGLCHSLAVYLFLPFPLP